jgi:L-fuculose-phosphate aldolase
MNYPNCVLRFGVVVRGPMDYIKKRETTAMFMSRLYERQLTTCSGGNISMRVSEDRILITPSGKDKGTLTAEDIALITLEGENLSHGLKLSIETEMHLAVYRKRADVNGIVHAHPLHGSLFTALDKPLRTDIIAEARYLLGEPRMAPYALMGTRELAEIVGETFTDRDTRVVLMENHGVITVGDSLFRAYDRMEVLEAAARMTCLGEQIGGMNYLSRERKDEIDRMG